MPRRPTWPARPFAAVALALLAGCRHPQPPRPALPRPAPPPTRVSDLLVCLDAASGHERWRKALPVADARLEPSPLVAAGQVVLHDGAALLGLDAASGEPRWRQPSPRPELVAEASGTVYA